MNKFPAKFFFYLSVLFLLPSCTAIKGGLKSEIEETPTGVRMVRDGKILWNFEINNPEGRPFFHPLTLPSGRVFTEVRPEDHIWHLGYWFSWKYINGVNYWEPADPDMKGCEPAGITRVVKQDIDIQASNCAVALSLDYRPKGADKAVLEEVRNVLIDLPNARGEYEITVNQRFTANENVILDRTPPKGSPSQGRWSGGYAGITLRLASDTASDLEVRGASGGKGAAAVTGTETDYLDFYDGKAREGFVFSQEKPSELSRFYVWKDKRMINASPVYMGPMFLEKGESAEFSYRLKVYSRSK